MYCPIKPLQKKKQGKIVLHNIKENLALGLDFT